MDIISYKLNNLDINSDKIEISGNLTADDIERYSSFSVSHLSSGSLTKHINAIDFSMRLARIKNAEDNKVE